LLAHDVTTANGFYIFAAVNALIYATVFATVLIGHYRENQVRGHGIVREPAMALALAVLFAMPAVATGTTGLRGLDALVFGAGSFRLTEIAYGVAGAGRGSAGTRVLTFAPHWGAEP
jgi:hypothetical protein